MSIKKLLIVFTALIFITGCLNAVEIGLKIIDKDINIPLEGVKVTSPSLKKPCFTDKDGSVKIKIDDKISKLVITCELVGYETKKALIEDFSKINEIDMSMQGQSVLEGKELVVEESYYNKKDKVGTSFLIDRQDIKELAMRGTMEDVVSSVKSMPGVSYSANFQTDLSVRGGRSDEIIASLDGFIVRKMFYWGNSYSIFNPNLVDSAVFNNGVFSVKNGMATSGLLEVNTITPDRGLRFDFKEATSSFESKVEIPAGKTSGFLISGRVTYLDAVMGPIWRAQGMTVTRSPYIYDSLLKWYWQPNDKFEWFIEGFYGADGISMTGMDIKKSGIHIYDEFYNENYNAIGFTGFKIIPNDRILLNFLAGYEFVSEKDGYAGVEKGEKKYSDAFNDEYGTSGSFDVDIKEDGYYTNRTNTVQSRFDADFELHKQVYMSAGFGLLYDIINLDYHSKYFDGSVNKSVKEGTAYDNLNELNPNAYINFSFYPVPDVLEIQLGCRVDHSTLFTPYNGTARHMFTYPVANPRFYIAYTPVRNLQYLEYITFSLGAGMYSKMPNYRYDVNDPVNDYQLKQEQVESNVLGMEAMFPLGFKLKIEGYYKYYFNRFYTNMVLDDNNDYHYKQHSDGYGHVAGFDIIFKRKISRYVDGWISYSFIYARFYNPTSDGVDFSTDMNTGNIGDPNKTWYYPTYHRWHSMNLVLDIKPLDWFTISTNFGVCSGILQNTYGGKKIQAYSNGGDLMEIYARELKYSDTNRTAVSLPFGLKLDFHFYFPKSKVKMEIYAACDNIFAVFYNPDRQLEVNKYNGNVEAQTPMAYETFMPSAGITISY